MFQLLEQAVCTGRPVIIMVYRKRGVKGKPKTRWYKITPIPECWPLGPAGGRVCLPWLLVV